MRIIKKGIKLHVAAKQFEFFEVWSETGEEVNSSSKEEIKIISENIFNELKNEVIRDSCNLMNSLNLPYYDNVIAKVNSTNIEDPVTVDAIDIMADIEDILSDKDKKTYNNKKVEDLDLSIDSEDFTNAFPDFK